MIEFGLGKRAVPLSSKGQVPYVFPVHQWAKSFAAFNGKKSFLQFFSQPGRGTENSGKCIGEKCSTDGEMVSYFDR